jgi:hypothetical protein
MKSSRKIVDLLQQTAGASGHANQVLQVSQDEQVTIRLEYM